MLTTKKRQAKLQALVTLSHTLTTQKYLHKHRQSLEKYHHQQKIRQQSQTAIDYLTQIIEQASSFLVEHQEVIKCKGGIWKVETRSFIITQIFLLLDNPSPHQDSLWLVWEINSLHGTINVIRFKQKPAHSSPGTLANTSHSSCLLAKKRSFLTFHQLDVWVSQTIVDQIEAIHSQEV